MRLCYCYSVCVLYLFLACIRADVNPNTGGNVTLLEERANEMRKLIAESEFDIQAQMDLAVTLQQLNLVQPNGGARVPEAEKAYRQVLSLLPRSKESIQVRGNLAALLMDGQGSMIAAIEEIKIALKEGDDLGIERHEFSGLMFNLGKAYEIVGDLEEANDVYNQTIYVAAGTSVSSFTKSVAALGDLDDDMLAFAVKTASLLDERFARAGIPFKEYANEWLNEAGWEDRSWLGFGLYKAFEKRKSYDDAWEHLYKANEAMKNVVAFDPMFEWSRLKGVQHAFGEKIFGYMQPETAEGQPVYGYFDPTPIFVMGMPRSGSTLIESMLASVEGVVGAGEDTLLSPLTVEVNVLMGTPNTNVYAGLVGLGRKYVNGMLARSTLPDGSRPRRVVDKMLQNIWKMGYIQLLLPQSCCLHVVRHPLDCGLSCYSQPFGYTGMQWAWDLNDIATQINMTWVLANHWDKILPGRILTIFYEDLIENPAEVAAEVLDHCGLEWNPDVLKFHEKERDVHTASVTQVRQPLYSSSVGRWKRYEKHIKPLIDALGDTVPYYEARLALVMARRKKKKLAGGHTEL